MHCTLLKMLVAGLGIFAIDVGTCLAQQPCANGMRVDGVVMDPAGAAIVGATVRAVNGEPANTDSEGRFVLACIPAQSTVITAEATGFATATQTAMKGANGAAHLEFRLVIATAQTSVQVNDDAPTIDADHGSDTVTLGSEEIQQLPDDPDDLLRQLQLLSSSAGGDASTAVISVNGFQNNSALPPKSSIASIRVNPDLFSAEYRWPPWSGGLIEIFTKPGADSIHGSVFFSGSASAWNASDPFALTGTPASKRRYGFDLSGPVLKNKVGYALALEKRDIDEFNVVNAVTLGADGSGEPLHEAVAAPQRLWIASARGDWQASAKDVASLSYSANVTNLGNQGVGGLTLPEAGYDSLIAEYDLRLNNTLTLNPNLLHETRVGFTWKRTQQTPLSTAAALQVAGYFNGGGATSQALNDRERDLEMDDDVMITHGRQTVKLGVQTLGLFVHDYDPDTFNGAFVFGGGSAPVLDANNNPTGESTTISALEQYRRATLNLAGGTPTTYQVTTGTPVTPLMQWRLGFFVQDTIKMLPRLTLDTGLRYQMRVQPDSFAGFDPRVGIAWSPDKKERWIIHLRGGLFSDPAVYQDIPIDVYRLNGVRQKETLIYDPDFANPLGSSQSMQIAAVNQFNPRLTQESSLGAYLQLERVLPGDWHVKTDFYWGADWNGVRIVNINAPMVASSVGVAPDPAAALLAPRPIAPNENIWEWQNSGHLLGNFFSAHLEQHHYKRFGLQLDYDHQNVKANVFGNNLNSPQSSYSELGESARTSWMRDNSVWVETNVTLPYKIEFAAQFDARDGIPYNVITGTDNNGDGDFNDRPAFAAVSGTGAYATRYGLLSVNAVNGNVPRNLGTMPGVMHLDANLSREFTLGPKNADHPRTITVNGRSANLLNHTNVTTVGNVVSSSTFDQPVAAETARRLEIGARFTF
ncbi:carboxypeptidase regulatory-like domain-containing protein [Acidicapsa dinghuensis]|uniref:Carboxypeptidase regulatory-like domain-containing protein n=2 Tax=Acidicapsa dinghuensis TaxID=2218256 RepID=A0ABW1EK12_9BACT